MAIKTIQITGVTGGLSASPYLYSQGQFLNAIGIDPDLPVSDNANDYLPSSLIRPSGYTAFSGANITAVPKWFVTNPKDAKIYALLDNGRFVSYDSAFANETLIATASSCSGNGLAYYNNYIYVFTGTTVDRYGPLNNSPSYTTGVWTGATLGSLTALTDTTYPTVRDSTLLPNHTACVHGDGSLYFLDYVNGQGLVHRINTKKVTYEGDTNGTTVPSAYNVLDLPFGYMPTAIASLGTDLVISAIQTTDSVFKQGDSALFIWDAVSSSFRVQIPISDPVITGLKNANGTLYMFSGGLVNNGYRLSYYAGGETIKTIFLSSEGHSPLQGAIDALGDKLYWGTIKMVQTTSSPEYYAVVMSAGSKDPNVPLKIQCPVKTAASATSSVGIVGAIAAVQQASFSSPSLVVGYKANTTYGIAKKGTTYGTSIFQSPLIQVGKKYIIRRIRTNLAKQIAANMTITPTVFMDDFSSSATTSSNTKLRVINSTNYSKSEQFVEFRPDINGKRNFLIEFRHSGSVLLPISLPIEVDVEIIDD